MKDKSQMNEKETREFIDKQLKNVGWIKRYVKDEVNTIKSDFKEKENNRNRKYFFVPVEEIKENNSDLSFSKYRELEYEEVKYEKPEVIKKKILVLEKKIIDTLKDIKVR